MKQIDDIITAIATPLGEGGISVVRVSGKGAAELVDKGFRGHVSLQATRSHTAHYGHFVDGRGTMIDEVVATLFRAPHSYTVEDVVEISCHGGVYVTRKILDAVIASGARLAEPGEFTKRAFLNGRIDLSQAEAVADLIRARSEMARRSSLEQLEGSLSLRVKSVLDRLVHLCGLVELELDFVEENITLTTGESLTKEISEIVSELHGLVDSFDFGRLWREGVKVVLVGRPNAGKSSLLNSLLEQNRAIVTEVPGTTRDVIEENIVLGGMLFRLVDTAGIRQTEDIVEKEGVRRTHEQIRQADMCLYVLDVSLEDPVRDREFVAEVRKIRNGQEATEIFVGNKVDLVSPPLAATRLPREIVLDCPRFLVSAVTRMGVPQLAEALVAASSKRQFGGSETSVTVTNQRHKNELEKALQSLHLARKSIESGQSGEVVAIDLRSAVNALGAIVGTVTTDDILHTIFSNFCIGK